MAFTQQLDTKSTGLAVGLDVLTAKGFALRLMYSQSESDHTRTDGGSLKISASF